MESPVAFLIVYAVCANGANTAVHAVEGNFGRAEVNLAMPSVATLVLRRANKRLEPQSLLSPKGVPWLRGMPNWGTEALTFAVDEGGRRFESRNRAPEAVKRTADGLTLLGVVLTHGHFDHVEGLGGLKQATGAPILLHRDDLPLVQGMRAQGALFGLNVGDAPAPDRFVVEGEEIRFGGHVLKVLHTPGHSRGSVSLPIDRSVFVGDLLFAGSIGRTDLAGGDYDTLIDSVRRKIFTLPDDTRVYPGHGPATTVGYEKRTNPFFR